ncbi:MAG: ABC transporter ATP-binding protein [Clostridia bacterium]|nr:ABC transporter ATP-binding protein [Clostridia bacterium]
MGSGPAAMMPVEKARDFKGSLKRLLAYLQPHRPQLIIVSITAVLGTAFSIYSPKVMGQATTKLFEGIMQRLSGRPDAAIDFGYIIHILFFLGGLYLFSAFCTFLQQYIMAAVSQKIVFQMRNDVNDKLARLPLKFFDSMTHGEILSRVTNDIDNISTTLQQSMTQLITSVVTLVGIVIMMLSISPVMTLIAAITLPVSFWITAQIAKRSQKFFKAQQKILGQLNGHVEEMYAGHLIVKAFGLEEDSIAKFEEVNGNLYETGWKAQFISGLIMPLLFFVNNIGYVLVCILGGLYVTRQALTIGDVQAFIQYSRQFTHPIIQSANIANIFQSTIASAERVFELLDEEEEIPENLQPQGISSPQGFVRFEHVDFGYHTNTPVIKNLDMDVEQGQTIAIVGPTGAGKTTLVNLLMRFYEIDGGSIRIDGVDIRELKRADLRSIFGMVLQDTWLFNGSIRDNIAYGRNGATEEEIKKAAKMAYADNFIRTLPDGYNTILNEEASNISQGQKQLLTIARAILANPAILILDEATSNVDSRTEALIQKAMTKLMQGRTSFVIAHRLSTIREADLILVINDGRIIEKGRHEELLLQGGFYADLYQTQFAAS